VFYRDLELPNFGSKTNTDAVSLEKLNAYAEHNFTFSTLVLAMSLYLLPLGVVNTCLPATS
jgi:hypothetical protein